MRLDDNYRIISDDYNFILQQRIPPTKKRASKSKEWQNIGYWKDLGQALQTYSRRRKRDELPSTLAELLSLEHALSTQIERIGEQCVTLWGTTEA